MIGDRLAQGAPAVPSGLPSEMGGEDEVPTPTPTSVPKGDEGAGSEQAATAGASAPELDDNENKRKEEDKEVKYKSSSSGSGKQKASNPLSWAKNDPTARPRVGEKPRESAERVLNGRYGKGNYKKGPGSEYNKVKKWHERSFE